MLLPMPLILLLRMPPLMVLWIRGSQSLLRDSGGELDDICYAMKKLDTDNEITKRLLLVVYYMNQQPNPREITVDSNIGVVTFGQFL